MRSSIYFMTTFAVVLNLASTLAAVAAAVAAFLIVRISVREAQVSRRTARFVRWCEEPARQAIEDFVAEARQHLARLDPGEHHHTTQQAEADELQAYIRKFTERLAVSMTLMGSECKNEIVHSCQDMEDGLLKLLVDCYSSNVSVIDVESEMYRRLDSVIDIVLGAERRMLQLSETRIGHGRSLLDARKALWLPGSRWKARS